MNTDKNINLNEKCDSKMIEHLQVPIDFLDSALDYQRSINMKFVKEKASDEVFDEREVEEVKVSARRDGTMRVCDGQHTVAILKLRGYHYARCEVRYGLTSEEENDWFDMINTKFRTQTKKRTLTAKMNGSYEKHKIEHNLNKIMERLGFTLDLYGTSTKKEYKICCPTHLLNIFKARLNNPDSLFSFVECMKLLRNTFQGDPISLQLNFMDGMFAFYDTYGIDIDNKRFIRVMQKHTPAKIKTIVQNDLSLNKNAVKYGKVFVDIYNKGLKKEKKLKVSKLYDM